MDEAFRNAESELLVSTKAPIIMAPDVEMDRRLIEREVKVRYLYETSILEDAVHGAKLWLEEASAGYEPGVPVLRDLSLTLDA